jgi:eukaryotic-like serine/threonine-protein kinase
MNRVRYLLPVIAAGAILVLGWLWLRSYTRHGDINIVPDRMGTALDDARQALEDRDMLAVVIDSVFNEKAVKGGVVAQDPLAGSEVKPGRKVYLVLNAQQPPMIDMPDLVDLSKRQALSVMEILGLNVEELVYKPDPCVDCVIQQRVGGALVAPGSRVRSGSFVTLVLGSGDRGERVAIPDLYGLTHAEIASVLNMASLNIGLVVECVGCNTSADSSFARVVRQSPTANKSDRMALGGSIDVWLTMDTVGLTPREGRETPDDNSVNDSIGSPL